MKRHSVIIISFLLSVNSHAQLTVDSLGCVTIANEVTAIGKNVTIGKNNTLSLNNIGLQSVLNHFNSSASGNLAILGECTGQNGGASIGVAGVAGKGWGSYNFGIIGTLKDATYGAGVLGLDNFELPVLTGKYAGYFKGKVNVEGSAYINGVLAQVSDRRYKKNIIPLQEAFSSSGALEKITRVNSYQYNYKSQNEINGELRSNNTDTVLGEDVDNKHFGVIAQELETVLPELIVTRPDGVKAVNYIELIPILIESIKELRQEVANLKAMLNINEK